MQHIRFATLLLAGFALLLTACSVSVDVKTGKEPTPATSLDLKPCGESPPSPAVGFKIQEYPELGYKISYPEDWTATFPENLVSNNIKVTRILYRSPQNATPSGYRANVNVVVEPRPFRDASAKTLLSLEGYYSVYRRKLSEDVKDAKLIEECTTTISGEKAIQVVLTGSVGNFTLKDRITYTVKDDKAYAITYDVAESEHAFFDGAARAMLSSMEFIK